MNQPESHSEPQLDNLDDQDDSDLTQLSLPKQEVNRTDSSEKSREVSGQSNESPVFGPTDDRRETPPPSKLETIDPFSDQPVVITKWGLTSIVLVLVSLLIGLISISVRNSTNAANATAIAEAGGTATQQALSLTLTAESMAVTAAWRATGTAQSVAAAYLEATQTAEQRTTATAESVATAAGRATSTAEKARTATVEARIIQNRWATATAERVGTATAEARLNAAATADHMSTATAEARLNETATAIAQTTSTAEAQATRDIIAATQTAVAAKPELVVSMMECSIEYDLLSRFGQVAHAWVTVQNIGTANATNIKIELSATDEAQSIPDSQKTVTTLPPGYQVTHKLTVDTYLFKATDITVAVSSRGSVPVREEKSVCPKKLDDTTKSVIEKAGEIGKIMLIVALK